MMDPMTIMTLADVARYLRVTETAVRRLVERGSIPSFEVGGEPRVQYEALVQWFQSEAQFRSLETLRRQLQEPSTWRNALDQEPELKRHILEEDHEEGTIGAFLKEVALSDPTDDAPPDAEIDVEDPIERLDLQPNGKDYLKQLRRRPVISILVAIGIVIIALGAFTDALQKIAGFVNQCIKTLF